MGGTGDGAHVLRSAEVPVGDAVVEEYAVHVNIFCGVGLPVVVLWRGGMLVCFWVWF